MENVKLFFPDSFDTPPPPAKFCDCGPEWRLGYGIGWQAGPAIPPDYTGAPRIGRFSPFASLRRGAFKEGVDAGRNAKRALVAQYVDRIMTEGTVHSAVWHGYPRDGWLWADAYFFGYGRSALPACVPADSVSTLPY